MPTLSPIKTMLAFRVSPDEREMLKQLSQDDGVSVSELLRQMVHHAFATRTDSKRVTR
jgi:hypothetical protein